MKENEKSTSASFPSWIEDLNARLINEILIAGSAYETEQSIRNSLTELNAGNAEKETVDLFVRQLLKDLSRFSPLHQNVQQWSNIRMARMYCIRSLENV